MQVQIPRPDRFTTRSAASVALEAWLVATGKRQVDVVRALDVSKQFVSVWVNGSGIPGLENAEALERLTDGAVKVMDWRVPASEVGNPETTPRAPTAEFVRARLARVKDKSRRKRAG